MWKCVLHYKSIYILATFIFNGNLFIAIVARK